MKRGLKTMASSRLVKENKVTKGRQRKTGGKEARKKREEEEKRKKERRKKKEKKGRVNEERRAKGEITRTREGLSTPFRE